jgi:hypothetical protein
MPPNSDIINLTYIVVELLVPIIPAFVLHRWLPNKTFVSGPLKGLKIDLTGAFAGYFLLFLLIFMAPRPKPSAVWKVIGKISPDSDITAEYQIDCRISPPLTNIPDNKSFEVTVPIDIKDGKETFPDLVVACKPDGKFETAVIHLSDDWLKLDNTFQVIRNNGDHTITIKNPVQLKKVAAPYSPPDLVLKGQSVPTMETH